MGTPHGGKLSGITVEALRERLTEQPEDGKAVIRLVAAREYKAGLSPAEIEEKYGWPEGTVYHWLGYLEDRGLDAGLTDQERSGRPAKLDADERHQLFTVLNDSPEAVGYDRQAWLPILVHDYIQTAFGVEYSLRHVRRLMREAGLSWRTARPRHYEADPEAAAEFQATVKKTDEP